MTSRATSKINPRLSLALDEDAYRGLRTFCREAEEERNLVRVTHVQVLRALLAQLEEEPYLRKQVISRL